MRTLCAIFTLFICANNFAQKDMVFLELGGNAQGASINYERQITKKKGLMLSIGLGAALVKEESQRYAFGGLTTKGNLSLPVSIAHLFKVKNENYIETGIGYTWINIDKNYVSSERGTHNFIVQVGFRRYFGKQKNWMWKANFSPILAGVADSGIKFGFSPMFGIAVGKGF